MILFHLSYRDCMEETFSYRNYSHNYSSNFQIIMWIMELTNNSFDSLENVFYHLQNNSNELFKEVYINLLKILLWNIPLFLILNYFGSLIDAKYIHVTILWIIVLLQYPPFKAFILILIKLIISIIKDFGVLNNKKENKLVSNEYLVNIAETIIPFFRLGKSAKTVLKKMNEIILFSFSSEANNIFLFFNIIIGNIILIIILVIKLKSLLE